MRLAQALTAHDEKGGSTMAFAWSNLSKNTLRELARAAGLKVTKAEDELRSRFGEPPSDELVAMVWPTLRDGWVLRTPEAREAIVERLRAAKLGKTQLKVKTRPGQMEYLKSCRMSDTLRRIVHDVLCEVGSHPFDGQPSDDAPTSGEDASTEPGELLQRACAELAADALGAVEFTVCAQIGAALRGVTFPVQQDDCNDVAASVATAALVAFFGSRNRQMKWEGEVPVHRQWLVEGARRLAGDRAACDRAVGQYFNEVASLVSERHDRENAQLTATSLFFTVVAFGKLEGVSEDAQMTLIAGLRWLLDTIQDHPSDGDRPQHVEPTEEVTADEGLQLGEFIDTVLRQRPGLAGPARPAEHVTAWFVGCGSATIRVELIEVDEEPPLLRYQASMLSGITSSQALLDTVNKINRNDSFHKVYLTDDSVVMEYDQLVDELTQARLVVTINGFMTAADQYDTILQDRFGGQTQAADVKAQFSV